MRILISCILFIAAVFSAHAVRLPAVINANMVLQRDMQVPIWGWGDAGEKITVSFAGQSKSATVGKNGKWMLKLDKLEANAKPSNLTVKGNNEIKLGNILVGEVWICSGQSNMEWKVAQCANAKEEIAMANHSAIRLFDVPGHTVHPLPQDKGKGEWKVCSPSTISSFSATGYYFGRRIHKELNVPVGLVGSNWGGTRIEPWTTLDGFQSVPELSEQAKSVAAYTADKKVGGASPSAIYNSMVHPLTPYAMRGAIWYQGESNGGEGITYYQKKHALVKGWRKAFQNPDLGFYWVQLCNFRKANVVEVKDPKKEESRPEGGDGWAKLREAQTQALDLKHTGMAVIIDLADANNPNDIHPKNKQDVGGRLAQWALHQTYDKKNMVPSGPLYSGHKIKGNQVHLSFKNVGKGLIVGKKEKLEPTKQIKNGSLKHFSIAGADKKWHWADAKIIGDKVVLSSKDVKTPVAARYAFTMNPADANLYNKEGLPAGPFRTDNW
ncbi:MAG: sialate O-acetylesterase [Opitutae bacterium]|jgi:sialate O-acetylesterase|nr:sialate O-acetylesterase [Opitutae bacterium]MBT5916787.1 sialate O-acetylesterase [Opitutae bacterium]MBT7405838.1 sialate O-acetylesterase [Opitutae bacterium]